MCANFARLLKISEVFGRPRRVSDNCGSTLSEDALVVPSGLLDTDPFANLCVALAHLLPAQLSGSNIPQCKGPSHRVLQIPGCAQQEIQNRTGNVRAARPREPQYLVDSPISASENRNPNLNRLETPLADEYPPIEILYDGFNFVNPQVPLFRESFLCDDVLFVPSSLMVENGFPYATFCMNKELPSGVDADTD
ncbi:hypothetical protein B0H13DRAFT_1920883 [Mycena leptocephala]|nr:hypothetical protein B0H13DRAFT_1920883 [Mycena leptocephala]